MKRRRLLSSGAMGMATFFTGCLGLDTSLNNGSTDKIEVDYIDLGNATEVRIKSRLKIEFDGELLHDRTKVLSPRTEESSYLGFGSDSLPDKRGRYTVTAELLDDLSKQAIIQPQKQSSAECVSISVTLLPVGENIEIGYTLPEICEDNRTPSS